MSKMAMVVILKSDHDMKILVWRGLQDAEKMDLVALAMLVRCAVSGRALHVSSLS